ncbi:MAG: insulinase family protein [Syntrophobacterales bacterium]|nr:MAG: insulinase family protein [Syntrophobacterales bacterium]
MKRFLSILLMGFIFSTTSFSMAMGKTPSMGKGLVVPHLSLSPKYADFVEDILPSQPGDLFVQLKNGLTVLIREIHTSRVVSCQVLVKAGSINEDKYFHGGLSHYLEHIVSGGTTSILTEEKINEILRSLGGASNAYTSYDRTVYFINTTAEHYKTALQLLISYVTDCQLAENEYRREKPVIQQEFKLGENSVSRQLWYLFMRTAYQQHPIRHPVIGYEDVFVGITREQLVEYYRKQYASQNMIVTLVGDLRPFEALEEVIELVKDFKRVSQKPSAIPEEPLQIGPRWVEREFPQAQLTRMHVGFPSVSLDDPDLYPLDVLAIILGRGRTSRLYTTVKDRKELVLSIDSSNWTPHYARGIFIISMSLRYENINETLETIMDEIGGIQSSLIPESELEKAKKQVIADHIFGKQAADDIASSLASSFVATGDPYFDDLYVEGIQAVTSEDVRRVAQAYLRRDRITTALLKPPQPKRAEREPILSGHSFQIEKQVLSNGMTLLLRENRALPVVTFQLFGRGGQRYEPPGQSGISLFTMGLLTKGTKTRSKYQIAKEMEEIGGGIDSSSGRNTYSVSVSVLKEDFEKGLEILSDVLMNPSFPEEEIEKQRGDTLLAVKRIDESWEREVTRLFRQHYFVQHPYRNDLVGTEESVRRFTRSDIVDFYNRLVMPNNMVLGIFGDIDIKRVIKSVEQQFDNLKREKLVEPNLNEETSNLVEDGKVEKRNDKSSAALLVGFNGMTLHDTDRPVLDVIDAILSGIGYPSGWLHESLRGGDKSLVYYVHAYPHYGIDGGYFGVITQTTMANYREVLDIILEMVRRIQGEPVTDEELELAKQMVVTMHDLGLETNASQAFSAAVSEALGLGYDWDQRYRDLIKGVTREDVQRVAKRVFKHRLIATTIPRNPVEAVILPERKERMHLH